MFIFLAMYIEFHAYNSYDWIALSDREPSPGGLHWSAERPDAWPHHLNAGFSN